MPITMRGNWIFVEPGQKHIKVASNFTNYLELGDSNRTAYYLEARVEDDEVLVNAILLDSTGTEVCRITNNFPKTDGCSKEMTPSGYRFLDASGMPILEIVAQGDLCLFRGTIYERSGEVVARDEGDDFLVFQGPAVLGLKDGARGIVIG